MSIGERLHELRSQAGYSQEQAAEILGISRQAVSKWESGQGKPDIDNVIRLAEMYHVTTDYILLGRENDIKIEIPEPPKKEFSPETRRTLSAIAVIAALAAIVVSFITALELLDKYIF